MPIVPYRQFQADLARERSNGDIVDYELGEDGVYRPVTQLPTQRPTGRPVPRRNPGLGTVGAAVDAVCLARAVAPQGFLRNLVSASPFDVVPGVRNARERAFNYLCGETPNAEVPAEIPYLGGQCNGVGYAVQVFWLIATLSPACEDNQPRQSQVVQLWGPIGGARILPFSGGSRPVQVYCRGFFSNAILASPQWITITSGGGSAACTSSGVVTNVTATRIGGGSDNCGNPRPQLPYGPEDPVPNLSLDLDFGGVTVNSPIDVSFNPSVGIEINVGDINITFDGENIDYSEPNDPGAGEEIPPLLPPSGRPSSRPSPDDTSTDPEDEPPPPPDVLDPATDEDDQPEEVIRAVLVTVQQVNKFTTAIDGVLPDADNYFPDLGTVKFRIKVSDTASGFTNPIRVQTLRAFIECPWDGGAFAVVGTPRAGVEWTLTPVYDTADVTQ